MYGQSHKRMHSNLQTSVKRGTRTNLSIHTMINEPVSKNAGQVSPIKHGRAYKVLCLSPTIRMHSQLQNHDGDDLRVSKASFGRSSLERKDEH